MDIKNVLNNLSIADKIFLIFFVAFLAINIYLSAITTASPDEGTHSLISLFYRDLIFNLPKLGIDFQKIYDFGNSYMAHYPKLQVTYPPLWHLVNGLVSYSIFGVSQQTSRLTTIFFAMASMIAFYLLGKSFFDDKISLIATFLFFTNLMSIDYIYKGMIDFSALFFTFLTLIVYFEAAKTEKTRYYLLTGIFAFLAVMGQRPAVILFPLILLHNFFIRKKIRENIFVILPFIILSIPYLIVLAKTGGFEINYLVVQKYGEWLEKPPLTNIGSWIWYLEKFFFYSNPLSPILLGSAILYFLRKEKFWKFLLMWLIIFWIGLTIPQNKEPRFYQYIFMPTYLTFSFYFFKFLPKYGWKVLGPTLAVIMVYLILTSSFILNGLESYPIEDVSDFVHKELRGNVGIISEKKVFSSVFMFEGALRDDKKETAYYRPCVFENLNPNDATKFLRDNGIQFLITTDIGKSAILNSSGVSLAKSFGEIDVYKIETFKEKPIELCNTICLTEKKICTAKSPFEVVG